MKFSTESPEFDPSFRLVTSETIEDLDDQHARARGDYESWKYNLMEWLKYEGKDPERLRGYSEETLRNTSYKIDQAMRWLWNERGYTTELTPEDADSLMRALGRYTEYSDANLNNFVKALKRLFKFYNYEKGKNYDWDCKLNLTEEKVTNRDYFYKREFPALYEASLEHGTVRHYHQCTPAERDELKAHLAQRFEMEKAAVSAEEFERANSFKVPSIVSVTLDCGLRPVEVARAKTSWVNFEENTLDIPKEESSKNTDNWKCVLSEKSVRALEKWCGERESYEKYAGRDELWLNKKGNPYKSNSLNYLLDGLVERAGIKPAGRNLTWYSIRHGVATIWADEENIHDAREQLRHKNVETTIGYAHSGTEGRYSSVNSKW